MGSSEIIAGVSSAATSYMATTIELLREPSAVAIKLRETSIEPERLATRGICFYVFTYLLSLVALFYVTGFRDWPWFWRWLFVGTIFGLASMIAGSITASWSADAFGYRTSPSNIIAVLGYQSGLAVQIMFVGAMVLLALLRRNAPRTYELSKSTNFAEVPNMNEGGDFFRLTGAFLSVAIYGVLGFYMYTFTTAAFGMYSAPILLADGLALLLMMTIRSFVLVNKP